MNKVNLYIKINEEIYDLTNTVESIKIESNLYDSPGKCEFTLLDNSDYPMGSVVVLKIDGEDFFNGYIFTTSIDESGQTSITAYDQLRYLKNQDTIYYKDKTASQILEDICKKNNLFCKIIHPSNWKVLPFLYEKKSMFDIIKQSLDETFTMENKKYIIRDNAGHIEFLNIENLKTNLQIGTSSVMTNFSYEKSIDEDTYNVVKMIRDNKETQKRDMWITEDSNSVQKWGKLQFLYEVDEQANKEQIKELGENILKVKNRETKSLDLSIIGFYKLRAGDGIKIIIDNLIDEWFFLESVSTNIENNYITCDLNIFIP